jgi:hypothetical protein
MYLPICYAQVNVSHFSHLHHFTDRWIDRASYRRPQSNPGREDGEWLDRANRQKMWDETILLSPPQTLI